MDTATLAECRSYSDRLEAGDEAWQRAYEHMHSAIMAGNDCGHRLESNFSTTAVTTTAEWLSERGSEFGRVLLTAMRAAGEGNHYLALNKLQELADMAAAEYADDNWARYE